MNTSIISFYPGDGKCYEIEVVKISGGYARGVNGLCAFCDGDPGGEDSGRVAAIYAYYVRNKDAEFCPCCEGKST